MLLLINCLYIGIYKCCGKKDSNLNIQKMISGLKLIHHIIDAVYKIKIAVFTRPDGNYA